MLSETFRRVPRRVLTHLAKRLFLSSPAFFWNLVVTAGAPAAILDDGLTERMETSARKMEQRDKRFLMITLLFLGCYLKISLHKRETHFLLV